MQLLKFLFILLLLLGNQLVDACNNSETIWQSLHGPAGGAVVSLVTKSFSKVSYMFAGTINGIYRSLDHGEHWAVVLPSVAINKMLVDDANNIYAATESSGVYVSRDAGATWTAPNVDSPIHAVSINDILATSNGLVYAASEKGVYISYNNGASWVAPRAIDPIYNTKIRFLAKDSANNVYAFALMSKGKQEIFKTLDAGKSWTALGLQQQGYTATTKFIIDPNDKLYLSGYSGTSYFYDVKDKQNPWQVIQFPESSINTKLAAFNSQLYAGFENGSIYVCSTKCNNINSWTKLTNLKSSIFDLLVLGETIYAGTTNGVYASFDKGLNWVEPHGINTQQIVNVLANDATTVYAGLDIDGISLAQRNSTNNWRLPLNNIFAIKTLFKPVAQADNVYLPSDSGLYSYNQKNGWQKNNDFVALMSMAIDSSGTLYVNNDLNLLLSKDHAQTWLTPLSDRIYCLANHGSKVYVCSETESNDINVLSSSDQGGSWLSYGTPEPNARINKLVIDSAANIYTAGYSLNANASKIYVYKEDNWLPLCQTAPNEVVGQLLLDEHLHYLYATAGNAAEQVKKKIYLYANSSCKLIYQGEDVGQMVVDPITGYIYRYKLSPMSDIKSNSGVQVSIDHGISWIDIPQFRGLQVNDILVNQQNGNIYAATQNQGIYLSCDHGKTWEAINSGLDSLAIDYLMLNANDNLFVSTSGGGVEKQL